MSLRILLILSTFIFLIFVVLLRPRHLIPPEPFAWQPTVATEKRCPDTYAKLFASDTVDFLVSFGYKDARPSRFVGDRYERAAFVYGLTSPCPKNFHACDFTADPKDAEIFTKRIVGPDGRQRTLRIRVISASAGPDDDENRLDSFQKWLSRHAQKQFEDGLVRSPMVFYNGHSRAGGGPDFFPPKLTRKGNEIDFSWYQSNQPGMKSLLQALKAKDSELKLLGLYSCVSTQHFTQEIHSAKPNLAVISSGELLYYADALRNLSGTISAISGMWCENEFGSAISAEPNGKIRIERFFSAQH